MAVLPFESVANDAPTNALGLGLTETVTAKLVQAVDGGHLQLVSTRELIAQGVKTPDHARREFGTDLVLEGSLQQDGTRIRVTWSLVDPRTRTCRSRPTRSPGTPARSSDCRTTWSMRCWKNCRKRSIPDGDRLCRRVRIRNQPLTTSTFAAADTWRTTSTLTASRARLRSSSKRLLWTGTMRLPMQQWDWLTPSGFQWKNRGKDWLDKAKAQCEHALAITPQLAEGHTCLGNVYFSTGRYEEAVQQFQRSLDLDGTSDETLRLLAAVYQKQGKASAAEEAYRKAISLRPHYWGVYNALGTFYYNQTRYAGAEAMFQKAIELAPLNFRGYSNLGAIYLLLGRYEEAVDALKQSNVLRPSFESYGNLGAAYFYMRHYQESAENLQLALKIDDKDWLNWGNLGDTLYEIPSRRGDALSAYRKAIELARARLEVNPKDSFALAFTADYYAMVDQEQPAREQMARALEIAPTDADVLFRAAILNNHFGDTEKTLQFLSKSVAAGYSRTVIRDTPDFDHLKGDAHFQALLPKS